MTTYAPSWLYFIDDEGATCEVFNSERLLGALGTTGVCGLFGVRSHECEFNSGVSALALDPCSVNPSGVQTWDVLTFGAPTDPANPAPWWDGDPDSPSAGGYGFFIEEWTGMDGAHMKRNVANRAGRRGGANFGALTQGHRVWKMNIIMVGTSDAALEDLFRWLEQTLLDCCDPCGGNDMLIRTACPPESNPGFSLYRVHGAAMLEGLTWEDAPVQKLGCYIRRCSVTIGVSDPCLYSCAVNCADEAQLPLIDACVPIGLWMGCNLTCEDLEPYRLSCPVPATSRGQTSPVVTIVNESTQASPPLRIYGMSDPLGLGPDPCVLERCQDIRTQRIPPGGTLVVDSSTRKTLYKDATTGQVFVDGTPFLDPDPGRAPSYLSLSCDPGWVSIEPVAFCGDTNALKISIDIIQRTGCC